ncbi:MAG: energy-coupling factor transporter transmembrane protein EcfT [Ruminococcaceae bacterium]|nr:energy-coupling factor transporter transmembrane protein EcfT [Oscillospiraceae bacterium]
MLTDITLGQYFPGNSLLHKADPRMKVVSMLIFAVAVFMASGLLAYLFLAAFVLLACFLSGISLKVILKGLKPVVFITVFMGVINIFFTAGERVLVELGFIRICAEGLWAALFIAIRIISLVMGTTLLLTYTTSPNVLCDAIESLLSPLKRLHVPVHDFAMMMTIALRFVPALIEETDKIMSAQKARGANFETGSLLSRAKALLPVLIPLLVSSIRRATDLATAMECRCYTGGEGRTKMRVLKLSFKDWLFMLAWIALGVALYFLSTVKVWGV